MALGFTEIIITIVVVVVTYYLLPFILKKLSQPAYTPPPAAVSKPTQPAGSTANGKLESKANGSAASATAASDANKPPISIFFGSQSGTAEQFARDLSKEGKAAGFKPKVIDLEDYDRDNLCKEKFAVFLVATFGEGDPTDNCVEFHNWLMSKDRDADSDFIGELKKNTTFAVFALGNKQYEHFCAVGRRFDTRFGEFGAKRLLDKGEGDDDGTLEDDYRAWKKLFWKSAKKAFLGLDDAAAGTETVQKFVPSFTLSFKKDDDDEEEKYVGGLENIHNEDGGKAKERIVAMTVENKELRQEIDEEDTDEYGRLAIGSTRHIEFDISGGDDSFGYLTADNLGVYPRNDYRLAAKLAKRLGVKLGDVYSLKRANKDGAKFPTPKRCSVEDALLWYVDFNSLCRVSILEALQQYATEDADKAKLKFYISTHDGNNTFYDDRKSILDVLLEFPSIQVPFVDFLEWTPKVQARFYTIASSSVVQPKKIAITVTVAVENLPRKRKHLGICSNYLAGLRAGKDRAIVFVRESTFRFSRSLSPSSSSLPPIIMIGPGSGLAPFRGFLQEMAFFQSTSRQTGALHLYFGCRNRTKDYIYQEELEAAAKSNVLSGLHLAFSRDGKEKVYVQDLLARHGEWLWPLIKEQNAFIYVCGGTAMGRSVRETIVSIAEKQGKLDTEHANQFFESLQKDKRYIAELWTTSAPIRPNRSVAADGTAANGTAAAVATNGVAASSSSHSSSLLTVETPTASPLSPV